MQVAARCLVDCLSDSANSIGLWLVWTNKTFQPPGFLSATVYKNVSHVMFTLEQYTVIIPITFAISFFGCGHRDLSMNSISTGNTRNTYDLLYELP